MKKGQVVFVIGKPGAGKTTLIVALVRLLNRIAPHIAACHVDDYSLLDFLAHHTADRSKVLIHRDGNFEILDRSLVEIGTSLLAEKVVAEASKKDLIFVEMARSNYQASFERFPKTLVAKAMLVYVDAGLNSVCQQRNRTRSSGPNSHPPVPERIWAAHYLQDDSLILEEGFRGRFIRQMNGLDDLSILKQNGNTPKIKTSFR